MRHRALRGLMAVGAAVLAVAVLVLPVRGVSAQEGTVSVEWLGWNAWRFTSPNGKVVFFNPLVGGG